MRVDLTQYCCTDRQRHAPITYGTDPEFVILRKENGEFTRINADNLLRNSYRARIGIDHCGHIGELRPRPARNAYEAVRNLKRLILEVKQTVEQYVADNRVEEVKLFAGGGSEQAESLGGHIHIGWESSTPNNGVVRATILPILNFFVGTPLKEALGGTRASQGYGGDNDFHRPNYGIEYRTPPSFIRHPLLVFAVFDTVKSSMEFIARTNEIVTFNDVPTYADYKMLGASGDAAYIMTNLKTLRIGGMINFDVWENAENLTLGDYLVGQLFESDGTNQEDYYTSVISRIEDRIEQRGTSRRGRRNLSCDISFLEPMLSGSASWWENPDEVDINTAKVITRRILRRAIQQDRLTIPDSRQLNVKFNLVGLSPEREDRTFWWSDVIQRFYSFNFSTYPSRSTFGVMYNRVRYYSLASVPSNHDFSGNGVYDTTTNTINICIGIPRAVRETGETGPFVNAVMEHINRHRFRRRQQHEM